MNALQRFLMAWAAGFATLSVAFGLAACSAPTEPEFANASLPSSDTVTAAKTVSAAKDPTVYAFTGGSGSSQWTATGSGGECKGTVVWDFTDVLMHTNADGELKSNPANIFEVDGNATGECNGHAVDTEIPAVYKLITGEVTYVPKHQSSSYVHIYADGIVSGIATLHGTVCNLAIDLGRFSYRGKDGELDVEASTMKNVKWLAPACQKVPER